MSGKKKFNITGLCIPQKHYMVDISSKLELLYQRLKRDYVVIDLSFEGKEDYFKTLDTLAEGLCFEFQKALNRAAYPALAQIFEERGKGNLPIQDLGERITTLCERAEKKVILMVDEVDKAADNQIFLTFLGLLRDKFLMRQRGREETFSSVILAGVHDIKNLKIKIRPEEKQSYNSPWNVAVDFCVDLSFSPGEIETILLQYENDYHTGMDISEVADSLYAYTEGYPFLVSCLCKYMDENALPWTQNGLQSAVKILLGKPNTLFDDIIKNLENHRDFKDMVEGILLRGMEVSFVASNQDMEGREI